MKPNDRTTVLRVRPMAARWNVTNSSSVVPIADFDERDDAVEYAIAVAQIKQHTVVEVYGKEGRLEARSEHALNAFEATQLDKQ
ncbi:DUF2188 domain-containing protein [Undibacterium arcticum]|uniref:DUF2188 domain-containing protein n=1 Tax=Undibacterium arcticum TaxID=1762892 RepID=A0ABV7FAD7_9BURK